MFSKLTRIRIPCTVYRIPFSKKSIHNQDIGNKLPEVLYFQVFHPVFLFDVIQLAMAAMTGHNDHLCTDRLYLRHFFPAVKYPLFVVSCGQRAATATTAELIFFCRIQINPVLHTLIEDPPGLFKKAMAK